MCIRDSNWGLDRFVKGANTKVKDEFKELKAKAKEMRKAEMKGESITEAKEMSKKEVSDLKIKINNARTIGKYFTKDEVEFLQSLFESVNEGKGDKAVSMSHKKLDKNYIKDYLKSIEMMARNNPMDFVKYYGEFTNDDWMEDVRYNMAN